MQFAFFETALRAQKSYSRLMEPVCKKWNLTHNELDVLLFLANNPERNRAADIVRGACFPLPAESGRSWAGCLSGGRV